MTAVAHEPLTPEGIRLEGFLALNTPEGFRAELIEGEVAVTPPPDGDHDGKRLALPEPFEFDPDTSDHL
jgi:hypothetical protein